MKPLTAAVLPLALCGCVMWLPGGEPIDASQAPPNLLTHCMAVVTPLFQVADFAAATVIAPGIAIVPEHAAMPASFDSFPERDPSMPDLLYYRTDKGSPIYAGTPEDGDAITLYGASFCQDDRIAHGVVAHRKVELTAHGASVWGMMILADAGHGFSGGPVFNSRGEWIGVTTDIITWTSGPMAGKTGYFAYWAGDLLTHMPPKLRGVTQAELLALPHWEAKR